MDRIIKYYSCTGGGEATGSSGEKIKASKHSAKRNKK